MTFLTVGKPVGQAAGPAKTTGQARFAADIHLEGMLWGAIARSTMPHARIVRINTEAAKALPGVRAVITAEDFESFLTGRKLRDLPVLAKDRVRFVGDRVAAVAADDPETAERAAMLVEVEYEELEAVFDTSSAMRPDAPVLHPSLASYEGLPGKPPEVPNTMSHRVWVKGDVDQGFLEADTIVQRQYTVPRQHQSYLEPHSSVAYVHPDGTAEVWHSTKAPFPIREQLAQGVGVEQERINVHVIPVGGDFGGKGSLMDLPVAFFLSKETGRPVKLLMSYVDEMTAANPRHPAIITIKTGVKRDGTIVAHQARAVYDSGAYGAFKPSPLLDLNGAGKLGGPYRIQNMRIDSFLVYTNQIPSGHMRSPGLPQAAFALESHLDVVARAIGMDPLEFRLKNVLHDGEQFPNGERWEDIRAADVLRAASSAASWSTPRPPNFGRGIALGDHPAGGGDSVIEVVLDGKGILVRTGAPDTGTGSHTILRQVVGEVLGLSADNISVTSVDTGEFPVEGGVGGSRVTHAHGQAAFRAANALRDRALAIAAERLGVPSSDVSWVAGAVQTADGRRHDILALAGEPLRETARYVATNARAVTSFCAQVAEVAVDPETGAVTVQRLISAHDVGTVINPVAHQGQIEGGIVQALGYALMEELPVSEGRVVAQSFADYKIPTMADVPPLQTILLEPSPGPAPFEAKAIAEAPNVPLAAAIANAVEDAVGVRIVDLPVSAEKVFRALQAKSRHDPNHD